MLRGLHGDGGADGNGRGDVVHGGGAGPTPNRRFVFANPPSHPKPNAVDPL